MSTVSRILAGAGLWMLITNTMMLSQTEPSLERLMYYGIGFIAAGLLLMFYDK